MGGLIEGRKREEARRFLVRLRGAVDTLPEGSRMGALGTVLALLLLVCDVRAVALKLTNATQEKNHIVHPKILSVSPQTGPFLGGTYVKVRGLKLDGATHCRFGLNALPVLKVEAHVKRVPLNAPEPSVETEYTVYCEAPAQDPGPSAIQITKDGNRWYPLPDSTQEDPANIFTFYELPRVMNLLPDHGPAMGGNQVRVMIEAINFNTSPDQEFAKVMFGPNITEVQEIECTDAWSPCYLNVVVPQLCFWASAGCDKDVPVYVSINGQDFTADPKRKLTYAYQNTWNYPSL